MLDLQTNGYTAAEVADAILGKNGVIERRYRFDLVDKFGNFLRPIYNVHEGGLIRYVEKQPIRRGGNIQIDEQNFTLTDDYLDANAQDNLELWLSTLYSQIFNESPLVYLRLGETSGTTATDSSGNSRNGTYSGGYTLNARSLVKTAPTNGSVATVTCSVTTADAAAFDASHISIGFHFNTVSTATERIVERDVDDSNHCWVIFQAAGAISFRVWIGGVAITMNTGVVCNDGRDHYAFCTYDGVYMRLYVDGAEVYKQAQTGNIDSVASGIRIGSFRGGSNYFTGLIDEFEFYGYALSYAQVRARYQAASGQLYEVDFLQDQIKVYCAIKMPTVGTDGTFWAEFPRGLFNFIYPDRDETGTNVTLTAIIQDSTSKLENETVAIANYTISTSTKYRVALEVLFAGAGFTTTQYAIATSTIAETNLPISKEYPIGTTYLYIVNELLREMNYRQASADSDGVIRLDAWVSSGNRQTEFTLTVGENSIVNTVKNQSTNIKETYNHVYLKRQGDKGVQEFIGQATNSNASHPTAIGRRRRKTYSDLNVTAASQTVIDAMAAKLLEEKSKIAYRLKIKTPLLGCLNNDDYLRVVGVTPPPMFSAAFVGTPPENFIVAEWTEPLSDVGDCEIIADFYLAA